MVTTALSPGAPANGGSLSTKTAPEIGATGALSQVTAQDLETIRNAIFKDATESELKLFLHDCQRQGVHPLDRLVYPQVRTDKHGRRTYTSITSIDLFRTRADETGKYAGNDDPTFTGLPKGDDFKAHVTVYKIVEGVRCPFTATARWSEYKPPAGQDWKWNQSPHVMLGKCAEALALRKAFPRQLAKFYIPEEMENVPLVAVDPVETQPVKPAPKPSITNVESPAPATVRILSVESPKNGQWNLVASDTKTYVTLKPEHADVARTCATAAADVLIKSHPNKKGTLIVDSIEPVIVEKAEEVTA